MHDLAGLGVGEGEGNAPQLDGADAPREVHLDGERLPGELIDRDVRQKPACIDINGVTARRLDNRYACREQPFAEVGGLRQPVFEVVVLQCLAQTDRHRFEVAPG